MLQKFIQLFIVLVIIAGGGMAAFFLIKAKKSPPRTEREIAAPLVNAEKVTRQDVQMIVQGYGTVKAKTMVRVVPQVSGQVLAVDADLAAGGFFGADEPLIMIDPRDYELAVQRSEASVARAQVQLDLQKAEAQVARKEWQEIRPNEKPTSPLVFREPQIRQAQAELAAAQADLATANLSLERTKISLPFNGRVIEESVDVGQYIIAGQSIATVYGTDVVEISVPLEDRELAWLDVPMTQISNTSKAAKGARAEVYSEFAGAVYRWDGQAVRMQGEVDQNSRMVHIVVEVREPFNTANGNVPLVPGMFVELMIRGRTLKQAISVPRHAVHNGNEVWLVQDDNLHIQTVEIARKDKDYAYVVSGLENDAMIITSPLDTVTEGMQVRPAAGQTGEENQETKSSTEPVK